MTGVNFCLADASNNVSAIKIGTTIWFDGSTTIHPFTCTATIVNSQLDGPQVGEQDEILNALLKKEFSNYVAYVPVKQIRSNDRDMDQNMYKALKAEKYPEICFSMQDYQVGNLSGLGERPVTISGILTIAGRANQIVLNARVTPHGQGFRIKGTFELLMKDYGIEPPSFMFVINVDNKILVHFDVGLN
jgi:hypothetical protein